MQHTEKLLTTILVILILIVYSSIWLVAAPLEQTGPLKKLAAQNNVLQRAQMEQVLNWAQLNKIATRALRPEGNVAELVRIENNRALFITTHNLDAAKTTRTDMLWHGLSSGLDMDMDGHGLEWGQLAIWDAGRVFVEHDEFASFGASRIQVMDRNDMLSSHSTHVAGTLIGRGIDPQAKGMAPAAPLLTYDWWNDYAEMAEAAANGLLVSNHSYGWLTGWVDQWWYDKNKDDKAQAEEIKWCWFGDPEISQQEDYLCGFYSMDAMLVDEIAYSAPYYLIVKSAGNERSAAANRGPAVGEAFWQYNYHPEMGPAFLKQIKTNSTRPADCNGDLSFDGLEGMGVAKNVLTVGAVHDIPQGYQSSSDVQITAFSSWGPSDDGRIKPDLVANGDCLYSSSDLGKDQYAISSGTSMAAANVSGSLALLQELYYNTHQAYIRSASLKALAIHTSEEAGSAPGPDYSFGWGLLNVAHAAQTILQDKTHPMVIQENTLDNHAMIKYLAATEGSEPLKITLVWTDPPAVSTDPALDSSDRMLINDLDLRVYRNDTNQEFQPWILSPQQPQQPAQTGDNTRDNVEQIVIANPGQRTYAVIIRHKGELQDARAQPYSLIITGAGEIVLPVEITQMSVQFTGHGVLLSWTSGSESENLGFQIYRSESADTPFQLISRQLIPGAGSSSAAQYYKFEDRDIVAGKFYYYRIADVDYQGQVRMHEALKVSTSLPADFNLEQNYPNPFYVNTQIRFTLKETCDVLLIVYNVKGVPVRTLILSRLQSGMHQISWDGRDQEGKTVPSGIYFCSMQVQGYKATRKMQLIK